MQLRDALGRTVALDEPARRVVSLVPSETETVAALAGVARLVGRTDWCEEPAGEIEGVPTVGGTKSVDVAAVIAARPDLVLANREENTPDAVARLEAAGLTVHVSFPCTIEEALEHVERLAAMLGVAAPRLAPPPRRALGGRVFAPVWKDPWMTFDGRTYASELLAWIGLDNVFADRPRRYPLAADLGRRAPEDPGARDTRYPRTTVEEIAARAPELVLLPDEPYRFDATHAEEVRALGLGARVELVSGKDLFWYGVRTLAAMDRLAAQLEQD